MMFDICNGVLDIREILVTVLWGFLREKPDKERSPSRPSPPLCNKHSQDLHATVDEVRVNGPWVYMVHVVGAGEILAECGVDDTEPCMDIVALEKDD